MTTTLGVDAAQSQAQSQAVAASAAAPEKRGMSFGDILGVLNPLQHIPVIGTIYRELTGDTISPAAQVAGDGLYGGIFGIASSLINELVEGETGKDIGGHIWLTLFGDSKEDETAATDKGAAPQEATSSTTSSASVAVTPDTVATTVSAPAASPPAPIAATPVNVAPATAMPDVTSFYQSLQRGGHSAHGVPLSVTVPMGAGHQPIGVPNPSAPVSQTPSAQATSGAPAVSNNAPTSLLPPVTPPAITPPATVAPTTAGPIPVPSGNIADAMMKALDKYKAVARQQDVMDKSNAVPALID